MIIIKLKGGVGNQLFQYALGKSLQKHYARLLVFDISGYPLDTLRQFELQALDLRVASEKELSLFMKPSFTERIRRRLNLFPAYPIVKEQPDQEGSYAKHIFDFKSKGLYLNGYWQNPRYFESIQTELKTELNNIALPSMPESEVNSVAIHIRRGDYIHGSVASTVYAAVPMSYYQTAMDYFVSKLSSPIFYIFSDDLDWCQENFKQDNICFVKPSTAPLHDLLRMSRMKHQVIANSTFSWWAAWLNSYSAKIVIAPKNWFAYSSKNEAAQRDLIPLNWIKL